MMADPMANLTDDPSGGGDGGGGDPSSSISNSSGGVGGGGANHTNTREVVDGMVLYNNMMRIDRIRSIMGIVSGCVVGIGGITGLQGFGTFSLFCCYFRLFICLFVWFC
jgi:EMC6